MCAIYSKMTYDGVLRSIFSAYKNIFFIFMPLKDQRYSAKKKFDEIFHYFLIFFKSDFILMIVLDNGIKQLNFMICYFDGDNCFHY